MANILDLDGPPTLRIRGRSKAPLRAEIVGPLQPSDLALLEVSRGSKPPKLLRLRDSHHHLAQCLASGLSPGEAGTHTGYSQSRISILLADKSFQDLVEVYRRTTAELRAEYADMATANMIRGERLVADSLEAAADSDQPLALSELRPVLDLVADRADRFGYPRKATNVNVNLDFAGKLESARRRAGLIDVTPDPDGSNLKWAGTVGGSPTPACQPSSVRVAAAEAEGEPSGGSSFPSAEAAE